MIPVAVAAVQPIAAEAAVTPDLEQPAADATAPVAADISQPQDVATNPDAKNHDPLANAVAAGAGAGAVIQSVICAVTVVGILALPACALSGALEGAPDRPDRRRGGPGCRSAGPALIFRA